MQVLVAARPHVTLALECLQSLQSLSGRLAMPSKIQVALARL